MKGIFLVYLFAALAMAGNDQTKQTLEKEPLPRAICLQGKGCIYETKDGKIAINPTGRPTWGYHSFEANGLLDYPDFINRKGQKVDLLKHQDDYGIVPGELVLLNKKFYDYKGNVAIDASSYSDVHKFAPNGLALVSIYEPGMFSFSTGNFKYGYINKKGELAIPAKYYSYADDFAANGLASVKQDGKAGYINDKGEFVIQPKYKRARKFAANGLAFVETFDSKRYFINAKDEIVLQESYNGIYGFEGNFADNGLALAAALQEDGRGGGHVKLGFIDATGKFVIPAKYDNGGSISYGFNNNGLSNVVDNEQRRWILIDANGNEYNSMAYRALKNAKTESELLEQYYFQTTPPMELFAKAKKYTENNNREMAKKIYEFFMINYQFEELGRNSKKQWASIILQEQKEAALKKAKQEKEAAQRAAEERKRQTYSSSNSSSSTYVRNHTCKFCCEGQWGACNSDKIEVSVQGSDIMEIKKAIEKKYEGMCKSIPFFKGSGYGSSVGYIDCN